MSRHEKRNARAQALSDWLAAGNVMPKRVVGQHTFAAGGRTIWCNARGDVFLDEQQSLRVYAKLGCGGRRYPVISLPLCVVGPCAPTRWNQHTLVALCHLPVPTDPACTSVDHKNSDRTDCSVSNLAWCTQRENNARARSRIAELTREVCAERNDKNRDRFEARALAEADARAAARAAIRAWTRALRTVALKAAA